MNDETSYTCPTCGERIVVPVDPSAGGVQEYVEDCPICCRAVILRLEIDDDGRISVSAEAE